MKILFQGDSITDAGRNYADPHDLGPGYPFYAAKCIAEAHPDKEFEFVNLGISGNQTKDLVARLPKDFVDVQPDLVSILIGINDVWHHADEQDWIPNEVFEERYRTVLMAIKEKTHAKILMLEPFLLPAPDKLFFRVDLDPKIQIVRKLAREFADVYLPTDGLLAAEIVGKDWRPYSPDGVHPGLEGAKFIGKLYAEAVEKLL